MLDKPISNRSKIKLLFLSLGIIWPSVMITLHSLKIIQLNNDRDFYTTILFGSAAGLGLQARRPGTIQSDSPIIETEIVEPKKKRMSKADKEALLADLNGDEL